MPLMSTGRLTSLLRCQRWRWAGPQPRPSLQGGPQGPAWRRPRGDCPLL